ncbi:MAG: hypothetical protein K2N23_02300, partial [Clostridia bacterium]|nr:hypothetical protein [Clostridia bacterium]
MSYVFLRKEIMLFDEYRKILNFKVFEFEFDELDNGTMKLAEFISCVNAINDSEINYLANGKAWDKVV